MKLLYSLTLGCLTLAGASMPHPALLRITVRVLNPARIPARTVAGAEKTAAAIFKKAGVEIDWVDCEASDICRTGAGPVEFWLHLLGVQPAKLSGDAMGFTFLTHESGNEGGYAAVSWPTVGRLADSMEIDAVPVLGAAMAHELGHLLLGSHSHSRDGVMAVRLQTRELTMAARGELQFDDEQSAAIRREIRRRVE